MKIVYIGASDDLAETLIGRFGREGNDIYLISDKKFIKKSNRPAKHRFFPNPAKNENFQSLIKSIFPDCIIYAGNLYSDSEEDAANDELEINLLTRSLKAASVYSSIKFVFLSSIEVYGNTNGYADERAQTLSTTDRGVRYIREEEIVSIYHKQFGLDTTILRTSQIYTETPHEGGAGFLSQAYEAAENEGLKQIRQNIEMQPLNAADLADAVLRVITDGKHPVYNVCGSHSLTSKHLCELISNTEDSKEKAIVWEPAPEIILADNNLIKNELGWRDFHSLEKQIENKQIKYNRKPKENSKKKKFNISQNIRQTIENLCIYAAFLALAVFCSQNDLFSQVNWLLIYVVLIGVAYKPFQCVVSVILASIGFFFTQDFAIFEIGRSFHAFAGSLLTIGEFAFLGLIVNYTITAIKDEMHNMRQTLDTVQAEYDDLRIINEENVLIKNEYEDRLLASKNGLPWLYSLTKRLMAQEPDRILMELAQVISEFTHSDTIAVYRGIAGNPYYRLIHMLNDASAVGGKSWNLSDYPQIYNAVLRGELYQGALGSDEPALVMPILCNGAPEVLVVIKSLPYESESLYHVNLLKTLSLLLGDSMERALRYEEITRSERYINDTDIMNSHAFEQQIKLAKEKADMGFADYCLIEFKHPGKAEKGAGVISRQIRPTDYLGMSDHKTLLGLLNNTSTDDLRFIEKRLADYDITFTLIDSSSKTNDATKSKQGD